MAKKETCKHQNQDLQDDISLTFQKLSIATISTQVDKSFMHVQSINLEKDQEQSSLSFSHLHRKIHQTQNKINKKTKGPKYCSTCQIKYVPKGYKNCIKCCFGNLFGQYLKTN